MTEKIQCGWGRMCGTEEDPDICHHPAVGIVAVRDGQHTVAIPACTSHRLMLIAETAPLGR